MNICIINKWCSDTSYHESWYIASKYHYNITVCLVSLTVFCYFTTMIVIYYVEKFHNYIYKYSTKLPKQLEHREVSRNTALRLRNRCSTMIACIRSTTYGIKIMSAGESYLLKPLYMKWKLQTAAMANNKTGHVEPLLRKGIYTRVVETAVHTLLNEVILWVVCHCAATPTYLHDNASVR